MTESTLNNAINTVTTAIATPLNWLDAIVISLLSGAITLGVGLLAALTMAIIHWWRPLSLSPLLRWVVAAGCGALAALLFVLRMTASHQTDPWVYGLCGALVAVAVLLLLMAGVIAAAIRPLWRLGRGSPPAAPAPPGGRTTTAAAPVHARPPDEGAA